MGFIYCNVKHIFAKLVEERAFLNKNNIYIILPTP